MDVTLCLTHDCTLRCGYCYAGHKRAVAMDAAVAEAAIELALANTAPGATMQLSFFGGEPLLAWDALVTAQRFAAERAAARGVTLRPTVTTNGTELDDDRARWLADHGVALSISLDGDREGHDRLRRTPSGGSSFDACLAGLRAALPHHPTLEVVMVVAPGNVDRVAAGARFLFGEGIRCVSLNPDFHADWDDAAQARWSTQYAAVADLLADEFRAGRDLYVNFVDAKILTRLRNGYCVADRCGFGANEIAVAPSGRLYPCERLVGDDDGRWSIGTVQDGLDEARLAHYRARRGNADPDCAGCSLAARCMNWCGCVNAVTSGAIDHTGGVVCFHEQLAIREADRVAAALWNERNALFLSKYYRGEIETA